MSRISSKTTFTIKSKKDGSFSLKIYALVVAQVTGKTSTYLFRTSDDIPKIEYADLNFFESGPIDILLGGDVYPSILKSGVMNGICGSLVAQETVFGWVVTGPTNISDPRKTQKLCMANRISMDELLVKFWELEEVPFRPILSEEDKMCEELFRSTTTRNSEGRYIVRLPFKSSFENVGPNRHIAVSQFLRNEKSLLKNPENKALYDEVVNEYSTLGHMKKVDNSATGYYLPHHGVFKPESTTTKLRVVFNASSVSVQGKSLNDILSVGPILQNDLVSLMMKWRFFQFVFNADITKMYRQILVHEEDTRFQRIIFRDSPDKEIQDFELKTVTFGVNCAPYLALRTLKQLAEDEEKRFPFGAKILRESMYVDDALVGGHSIELLLEARNQFVDILKSGGFEVRKWTSNSSHVLKGISPDHLLSDHFVCLDDKSSAKMLGIRWNASADNFYFLAEAIPLKSFYTKREVLSIIAKLFDPAGWLAPIIITAKILMQQMWLDKIDWDDSILPETLVKWKSFISCYEDISSITIPRWIHYSPNAQVEFHGFCDASELAYAAVLYARIEIDGHIFSNILVSKSKVAPIKKPSIPRLELCGATLLARLIGALKSEFPINESNFCLWSDSTIVLAWLKKPPCTWKTFVANRVAIILQHVGNKNWSHVISQDNPADLATRGASPSDLKDSDIWWHGPSWLRLPNNHWPKFNVQLETTQEAKGPQVFIARSAQKEDILDRFSSFSRALHVIAYVFRFAKRTKEKYRSNGFCNQKSIPDTLTYIELKTTRTTLFLLAQKLYFPSEYENLEKNKGLPTSSPLLTLSPFLDKYGVIRANSRLAASNNLAYCERHPIILAYHSKLSRLYVDFIHKLTLHGGMRLVHSVVRQECWIIRSKILIKTIIHNCKECVIYRKTLQGQIMAPLPETRTSFSRPFTNTGVDFAGPFEIKSFTGRYCRITKGYICLFVCFATKAIHLEPVSDLSTPAFLAALSRFVSRRGCPNAIYSDNGKNFVGAAREIEANFAKVVKEMEVTAVLNYSHQPLKWHFIPASAPHMGGLWEAGVKSVKMHLKKTAGQIKYTFEEFATLLASIEACLNSRPLGPLSEDPEELLALTPGHFLIGSAISSPAEPEEVDSPLSIVNRWKKVKAMHYTLCRRWKEEYLQELHKRNKWKTPQIDLKVDDLVVLRNEPICPTAWRLGRVLRLFPGSDSKVRVVELKTQSGIIKRPIHKLVKIPNCPNL